MHIYNHIEAVKRKGEMVLVIGKPSRFLHERHPGGDGSIANWRAARTIGHDADGSTTRLDERVRQFYDLMYEDKDGKVVLADNSLKWNGHNGGIVLLVEYGDDEGGFSFLTQYSGQTAERGFLWNAFSATTGCLGQGENWQDFMLRTAVESTVMTHLQKLLLYKIQWDELDPDQTPHLNEKTRRRTLKELADAFRVPHLGIQEVPLHIVPAKNAVQVVDLSGSPRPIVFHATPIFDTANSALKLVNYGILKDFSRRGIKIWRGVGVHHDIHEISPFGDVIVHQNGKQIEKTDLFRLLGQRSMHQLPRTLEGPQRKSIQPYTATAELASLAKADVLPYELTTSVPLEDLQFGNAHEIPIDRNTQLVTSHDAAFLVGMEPEAFVRYAMEYKLPFQRVIIEVRYDIADLEALNKDEIKVGMKYNVLEGLGLFPGKKERGNINQIRGPDTLQFVVAYLHSDYAKTEQGDLKSEDELIAELEPFMHHHELNFDRLRVEVEEGEIDPPKRLQELVDEIECSKIKLRGFEIIKKLGEGGSGRVYLARKEHSQRPRKIKIFKQNRLHPLIAAQRERRPLAQIVEAVCDVLAELNHPHLARYYDHGPYGKDREQTFYISSEYVEGTTVEEALPGLTNQQKGFVFRALANALRYLHNYEGEGYILRDLKLNNTIISPDRKIVKVTDLETITAVQEGMYQERPTRGSDKYAAPELIKGQHATKETDYFALGACLFYLIKGQVGGLEEITILPKSEYEEALHPMLEGAQQSGVSSKLTTVLPRLLTYDPKDRDPMFIETVFVMMLDN